MIDSILKKNLDNACEITGIPQSELEKLISIDFKDDTRLPSFMKLANIPYANKVVAEITEEFKAQLKQVRKDFQKRVDDTFRTILYNLVLCSLTRERLALPGDHKSYNKGTPYSKVFLTRRAVKICLDSLGSKYLSLKPGNTYSKKVNSYEPNKLLQLKVIPLIYAVVEEYTDDTELIIFKDMNQVVLGNLEDNNISNDRTKHIMQRRSQIELERTYETDLLQLKKINEALKGAVYALKAPVKRIYSHGSNMEGGRLYVPLQGLPDKRARVRINTLFNGNTVAEVDLKANHSAMLYALKGKQLPKDFYDIIARKSGQTKANVKWLVMKMIGASTRAISLFDTKEKDFTYNNMVLTSGERDSIETAIKTLFPELYEQYYTGMGIYLQGYEGDILLDAMCDLLDDNILSLPIHDALYVEQKNIEAATIALKKAWKQNLDTTFEPFVDIDYP